MKEVLFSVLLLFISNVQGQFFDPVMDDRTYLDNIQRDIIVEVDETKAELKDQAKIVEDVTRNFIGAKLKENLFIALRVLAEKELNSISIHERMRQPRQDEGGDDGDAGESEGTTRRNQVIPQVAGLIKAVFGGNINLTSYVESATNLLPKPVQKQVLGFVKFIATNPGDRWTTTTPKPNTTTTAATTPTTTTTTPAPPPPPPPPPPRTQPTTQSPPPKTTEEDEDEDEDEDGDDDNEERSLRGRQLVPGHHPINHIVNSIGSLLGGNAATTRAPVATTESLSGFEEEKAVTAAAPAAAIPGININSLTEGLRNGLGDLIKVMPDIFQGAREAYKLLGTVTGLFNRLDEESSIIN